MSRAGDGRSIDTIVPALYECISGRAGEARDWERFRALVRPDARFLRSVTEPTGRIRLDAFDVEGYIADVSPFLRAHDFHEVQIGLSVERSGAAGAQSFRIERRVELVEP